ncbi:hypothetical protein RQM65_06700 [Pricia sp. S334]|uniref:Uncharacterized protein n=1 Tax=Pricia mediterranea TaxID=3076079 RepID=A0ABU3L4J1_9FLAO|nr:hypothetical protein [Pricia sp. S334]MDT7828347.1 hypothetical protein [Pricia sp. S334]
MDVILPKDLQLRENADEEFQYCINELESHTILPITITNIGGEIIIKEYCLRYPPEWGKIVECKENRKNPINLKIKTSAEFTISFVIPEFETSIGIFGIKIYDTESQWDTRFKIFSPPSLMSEGEESNINYRSDYYLKNM